MGLTHHIARLVGIAALAMLTACGGGGGSSDTSNGNANGSTPPPATGQMPPPDAALPGQLWHTNYALDYRDGTQIASPSGAPPQQVTTQAAVTPWPDGRQYVLTDYDHYAVTSRLQVVDMASGTSKVDVVIDGYLSDPSPSPADHDIASFLWAPEYLGDPVRVILRLGTLDVLQVLEAGLAQSWLPDGRWLSVAADGSLQAGRVDGSDPVAIGRLPIPAGYTRGPAWVNRQGDRLALRLTHPDGPTDSADIWVAALDGSGLHQLTDTKMAWFAHWSPDGRHVAFDLDSGHVCTGYGCIGHCELWYAPQEAERVKALTSAPDAGRQFTVHNRSGTPQVLGCELLGWTD